MEDSAVRDRIVMGIRDDATRRKLLLTRKLDLKGAIDRPSELAAKVRNTCGRCRSWTSYSRERTATAADRSRQPTTEDRPTESVRLRNHFCSVCLSTDRPNVCELLESDNEVLAVDGERSTRLYSRLNVGNRTIRFLVDCGATVNLLPAPLIDQLGPVAQTVRLSESNLRMFDDTRLQTDGMVSFTGNSSENGSDRTT